MRKRKRGLGDYINNWTIAAVLTVFVVGSLVCLVALLKYASMRAEGKGTSVDSILPHSLGGTPSAEREAVEWSCDDLGKWFVKKGFAKDYQAGLYSLEIRLNDGRETMLNIERRSTVFDAEEATKSKYDSKTGMLEHFGKGSDRVCWGRFVATEPIYTSKKNNIPLLRKFFLELSGAKEKKDTYIESERADINLLQPLRKPSDVTTNENR